MAASTEGTPVLLVHGFPETWWTFHKVIPLLAGSHRVYAVDLRGFGDSDNGSGAYDSKTSAKDLGVFSYVTKPFGILDILGTCDGAIRASRAEA